MRRTLVLVSIGISALALFAPVVAHRSIRLVYNPTDSVPPGWYLVSPGAKASSLRVGSIALASLPADAAALAAQRSYLPTGVPILKRVAAVAPQSVCIREQVVRIDDDVVGTARQYDGQHRPLSTWSQCRVLADDEVFLLSNTNPSSFDSRYFGPIHASAMLGVAQPLWTWSTP